MSRTAHHSIINPYEPGAYADADQPHLQRRHQRLCRWVRWTGAHRLDLDQLEIIFSDNGNGMPEEVQRHVFDPFFTTKRAQGDTGLDLYVVHNLVTEQLGGRITLVSAPGKGTTIYMILPLLAPGRAA